MQNILLEQRLMCPRRIATGISPPALLRRLPQARLFPAGATAVRDAAPSQKSSPVSAYHRVIRGVAAPGTLRVDVKVTSADCETSQRVPTQSTSTVPAD